MRIRLLVLVGLIFTLGVGAGFGATEFHIIHLQPGDEVIINDLGLRCYEIHSAVTSKVYVPPSFDCGDTGASSDGPYVRVTPTRITIAATSQRILFAIARQS